jgi:hypothetical protein
MTAPFAMLFSGVMADLMGIQKLLLLCGALELLALILSWSLTSLPNVEDTILKSDGKPETLQKVRTEDE